MRISAPVRPAGRPRRSLFGISSLAGSSIRVSLVLGALTAMVVTTPAIASVCRDLEAELASARGGGLSPRAIANRMTGLAHDVSRLQSEARAIGCVERPRSAVCRPLLAEINALRSEYERLDVQRQRGGAAPNPARERRILAALGANNCGARYAAYAPQPRRAPDLLGSVFAPTRETPRADRQQRQQRQAAVTNRRAEPERRQQRRAAPAAPFETYRTVCVRTCDGFFWPLSFSTTAANFETDAQLCQASCPGTEVALYAKPAPFGETEEMRSVSTGGDYTALDNAFRYRREIVPGCGCPTATEIVAQRQAETAIEIVQLTAGGTLPENTISLPRPNPKRGTNDDGLTLVDLAPGDTPADGELPYPRVHPDHAADWVALKDEIENAPPPPIRVVGPSTPILVR
ncbi:MAG: DUF2865 domain-containing protein [Pseudomonadota bacterium]